MDIYVTITGHKHYFGLLPFYVGGIVVLIPEPDNLYDSNAVAVYSSKYGKVGFVAQSDEMRADGTSAASSLLPLESNLTAVICFIAGDYVIAKVQI